MKSVAIISKPSKPELKPLLPKLLDWLREHGYEPFIDQQTAAYVSGPDVVERDLIAFRKPEFVVVLGGDGTLLAAARAVARAEIPILGVNLGSLGFLTEVSLADLYPTLQAVHEKRCAIDSRAMLHCQLVREGKCASEYEALNDVVVSKGALARISDFDVYIDDMFVSNYKADGLIIATPTGSTAYSLAAGGPILAPDVPGFVITPVSSHALTNRPLVVRDAAGIEIRIKSTQEDAFLTVDGQVGMPVRDGDRIACRKSKHQVKLLRRKEKTFFDVLRVKLKWGER
ncbi:MAG: NAD(+)/NADH kinase [Acidobacteriales bacterium]|nr:NAD(+)/NADH kinase [Terriglobales bacterium]